MKVHDPLYRGTFWQKMYIPETYGELVTLLNHMDSYQGFRLHLIPNPIDIDLQLVQLMKHDAGELLPEYFQHEFFATWKDEPKKPKLPA